MGALHTVRSNISWSPGWGWEPSLPPSSPGTKERTNPGPVQLSRVWSLLWASGTEAVEVGGTEDMEWGRQQREGRPWGATAQDQLRDGKGVCVLAAGGGAGGVSGLRKDCGLTE